MNDTKTALGGLEWAAASVAGRDHRRAGKNNQDAYALWRGEGLFCAVVADGCGAMPHSEVGAQLGARLLLHALSRRLEAGAGWSGDELERLLEEARAEVLEALLPVARGLAGSDSPAALAAAVRDHLLFTLVGGIAGPGGAALFALGDGALALDGERLALGPFARNEPPYLGYALLPERAHGMPASSLTFRIAARAASFRALALGSDGALDLFAGCPPETLLGESRLFEHPDALRRKLWLLTQPSAPFALPAGAPGLRDDTTLVLLRHRAGEA